MISRSLFLECYPDKDIFESRVGQNWQLLVPAASRSICGYIDESLYIVNEHSDSHSRHKRTTAEMYQRWDMFTDVLRHAVDVSRCDEKQAYRLIEENRAREQFYYAVSCCDKSMLMSTMAEIKKFGHPTMKEWLLYLKCLVGG